MWVPIAEPVAFNLGIPFTNSPPRPPVDGGGSLDGLQLVVVRAVAALLPFDVDFETPKTADTSFDKTYEILNRSVIRVMPKRSRGQGSHFWTNEHHLTNWMNEKIDRTLCSFVNVFKIFCQLVPRVLQFVLEDDFIKWRNCLKGSLLHRPLIYHASLFLIQHLTDERLSNYRGDKS